MTWKLSVIIKNNCFGLTMLDQLEMDIIQCQYPQKSRGTTETPAPESTEMFTPVSAPCLHFSLQYAEKGTLVNESQVQKKA